MNGVIRGAGSDGAPAALNHFGRWGRLTFRRRWLIVGVWLVALIASLPLLPLVPGRLRSGGFSDPSLPSAKAQATLRGSLGVSDNTAAVFYVSYGAPYADPTVRAAVAASLERLRGLPQVKGIVPPDLNSRQIGATGKTAYALVSLTGSPESDVSLLPELQRRAAIPADAAGAPIETTVAGGVSFFKDLQDATERDLKRSELITLPIAAIALVIVFGSLGAASIPVMLGAATTVVGLAGIFLLSFPFDLSIFVLNLASMLALGLGTDYALFLVSRFREELSKSASGAAGWLEGSPNGSSLPRQVADGAADVGLAVERTVATAGRAVFFSAGTVLVGLLGLTAFPFMLLRSLGIAGMVAVAGAVLAALTLLPAVLGIVGPRINALALPSWRGNARPSNAAPRLGAWERLATFVLRHPWRVLVSVLALLIALGAPFAGARLSTPDARILPHDTPSRHAADLLAAEYPAGNGAPLLLAITAPGPITAPEQLDTLYAFTRAVAADPRVAQVDSIVNLDPRLTPEQYHLLYANPEQSPDMWARGAAQVLAKGNSTLVSVVPKVDPIGPESKALVRALRATVPAPGWKVQVTGAAAGAMDLTDALYRGFPVVILFVVAVTYVLLLVTFRSAVLPAKAVLMNALSLLASYGALAAVFQDGLLAHLPPPLGVQPLGYVEATLPILLFCTLFGLSMDYEVFLLSRVQEAYLATGDNARSVAVGLQNSGRVITGAAAIVVAVAGSFALAAGVVQVKALGLGIAIAVLVDATIVRALLVPATMRLLGDWNWWLPAWLGQLLHRLDGTVAAEMHPSPSEPSSRPVASATSVGKAGDA